MTTSNAFLKARADSLGRAQVLELQSLRGIAALVVLVYHAALYFDYGAAPAHWMTVVLNAHAAVVSFFVLSGLVLTLSLMRTPLDGERVGFFYLRRVFRIYPALWLACGLAVGYFLLFHAAAVPAGASTWGKANFAEWPVSATKLALALAGLKPNLPVPIWSLAIELLASLAMPAIVLTMRRSAGGFAVLLVALAALSTFSIDRLVLTPTYLIAFALGAAIALLAPAWRAAARSPRVVVLVAGGGFVLMWFARHVTGGDFDRTYHQGLATLLEGIGAAMLIGTIFVRPDCFRPLAARWAVRLGDLSYSLYLLHLPVIGIAAATAGALAPHWVAAHPGLATLGLVATTLAVTLPLADRAFRHIELPAIGLGQRLVRRVERHRRGVAERTFGRPVAIGFNR